MAIDKNPRQITRLRVEDQAKLEKLASVTGFDEGDDTPQFDTLYVDGSLVANNLYLYETIDFPGSASLKYSEEDSEFIFSNSETEFSAHLPLSHAEEEILTDKSVKTLFGNQSIVGSGNIDLYNHFIKITAGTFSWYGVIQSSNNLDTTGVGTKLQTLLKCKANEKHYYYVFASDDVAETGVLYWTGSVFQIKTLSDNYNVTAVEDKVETV